MKQKLIGFGAVIMLCMMLVLLGNIITIGDKLAAVHHWVATVFYLLLLGLFLAVFIVPLVRVLLAPTLPPLDPPDETSDGRPVSASEYAGAIRRLIQSEPDVDDEARRSRLVDLDLAGTDAEALRALTTELVEERMSLISKEIRTNAMATFLLTAISQKNTFDFFASVAINFRMISNIVRISGFKPTLPQLVRLYTFSIVTPLTISAAGDVLDNLDFMSGAMTSFSGSILGLFAKSAAGGSANALVTLRIGYVTREYIRRGDAVRRDRKALRRGSWAYAVSSIVPITADCTAMIAKKGWKSLTS